LEVDGTVLSKGHFLSLVSSALYSGLVLWDSLVLPGDNSVHLTYDSHGTELKEPDPRESHLFIEYFRSRGKLIEGGGER
jgi:hypothetical protein